MLVNNSRPPFDDPVVRQALQHAVDTQAIADSIYEGAAVPAIGPFSPDDPWAPKGAEPIALDKDEAESLFEQAGVDPSALTFELIAYNDRPEFADLAAVIQDELGQLGITVKIKTGEYASFEPALRGRLRRGPALPRVPDRRRRPGRLPERRLHLRRRLQHRSLL